MRSDDDDCPDLPDLLDQAGDLVPGLPPQIRRSLFKAAGRVLTGLAEWPAAYLEGKAEVTRAKADARASDIRGQQRAREMVLMASASAAAEQFGGDPELAARALQYHAAEMIMKQESLEAVVRAAADELRTSPPETDAATEIDEDWLTTFFREASSKTNEDIRKLFGRILAGELKRPGSFSLRTIILLSLISPDQQLATKFVLFCSLCIDFPASDGVAIACHLGQGAWELRKFGLSYACLERLIDSGLILPDVDANFVLYRRDWEQGEPFRYSNMTVRLQPSKTLRLFRFRRKIALRGPTLSQAGRELKSVVSLQLVPEYTKALRGWFRSRNLVMYMPDLD